MSTTDALAQQVAASAPAAPKKKLPAILDYLRGDDFQNRMKMVLPKALTPERLTRIVFAEVNRTPALTKCSPQTFYGAVLQCAQLGLEPGSALGHCYLLPFGNGKDKEGRSNCQLIIGYRGMIDLARRSGQIVSIGAYVVHEKDDFHYELGLHPDIHHIPSAEADPGPVTYVYAVANLKGGGVQFEVMSRAEIEKVRSTSKAGKSGPWCSHWDEMAKKTVIRRLFKYLPVSIEAARAVEVDEQTDRGLPVSLDDFVDGEWTSKGFSDEDLANEAQPIPTQTKVIEPAKEKL